MEDRAGQMIVERAIEIVSEASRHIPLEIQERHPNLPWRQIRNIGNILRHEYQRVDQTLIWKTAVYRLPELAAVCRSELEMLGKLQ